VTDNAAYPRFSDAEFARRDASLQDIMDLTSLQAVMAVGGVYEPYSRTRRTTRGTPPDFTYRENMLVVRCG
jgi:hypothetical protein